MKKLRLGLLLLLVLAAACTKTDPSAVFVDPNAVKEGAYGALYFESDGVRFGIYDKAEPILAALPAYSETFERQSCAFEGNDTYYFYAGYELLTYELDGAERITGITVTDDTVRTPQGLYIGMTEADLTAALPDAQAESGVYTLVDGTALVSVTVRDAVVTGITFAPSGD